MQFLTTINNAKCLEWGINGTQGALFSLLYEINAWAKEEIIDNKVYYFISRNKILDEMPLYYEKTDTIYRHLKVLKEKGIIEYIKAGKKDLIRITEKGKEWNFLKSKKSSEINPSKIKNSEINPTKLGNKSEKSSEINPTNQDTILNQDTNISSKEKINKKEKTTLKDFVLMLNLSESYKNLILEYLKFRADMGKPIKTTVPINKIIHDFPDENDLREAINIAKIKEWQGLEPKWIENYKKSISGGNENGNNKATGGTGKREVITRDYNEGTEIFNQ